MADNKSLYIILIIVGILIVSNLTGFGLFSFLSSKPFQITSFSHSSCDDGTRVDKEILSYSFDYGAANRWDCEESICDGQGGGCNRVGIQFDLETTDTIQNGVTNGDLKLNYYSLNQPTYSINTPISCSSSGCTGTPFPLTSWDNPQIYIIDLSPYAGQTISSIYFSSFETDSSCKGSIEPCQGAVIIKVDLNLKVYTTQDYVECYNNDVYNYDSNNLRQNKKEECGVTSYSTWTPDISTVNCGDPIIQSRTKTERGCSGTSCYATPTSETKTIAGTKCDIGYNCISNECVLVESCTPSWTPDISTVCSDELFNQIDGCGDSRESTGTKICEDPFPEPTPPSNGDDNGEEPTTEEPTLPITSIVFLEQNAVLLLILAGLGIGAYIVGQKN